MTRVFSSDAVFQSNMGSSRGQTWGQAGVKHGVKQGSSLASTLFAIFITAVFSYVHFRNRLEFNCIVASLGNCLNFPVFVQNRKWPRQLFIRELLYADEAAFMAITTPTLQNLCSSFPNACAELDISIRISKTVVLPQGPRSPLQININVAVLQSVDRFCYLRSTFNKRSLLKSELDIH